MIFLSLNSLSHKTIPEQLKRSKLLNNKPKELNTWFNKLPKIRNQPSLRLREKLEQQSF
jgi:hypothetical protein